MDSNLSTAHRPAPHLRALGAAAATTWRFISTAMPYLATGAVTVMIGACGSEPPFKTRDPGASTGGNLTANRGAAPRSSVTPPSPPPTIATAQPPAPAAVPPPPSKPEWQLMYEDGISSYENGAYGNAIRKLREVVDNPRTDDETRLMALKFMAFSYCVSPGPKATNLPLCRQTFTRALRINASFDLAPGERGHPVWGKEFVAAKKALAPQPPSANRRVPPGKSEWPSASASPSAEKSGGAQAK